MLYKQVANPKGIDSRNRVQRILIKIPPTFQPNRSLGNDSNLLIVFYVQIMPDDLVMQLHRF